MAEEEKKYLVNVESNLDKYAEEAAEAKKKVEELTAANKALKESGTATAAEIEANNAALRNAQKEYSQAKKLVDLQTAANKSEAGSRKQLGEIIQIEMLRLGKLGNAYTVNAQGQRVLSQEYINASKRVADAKEALIAYDQQIKDGRSNVGRYSESMKIAFQNVGKSMTAMLGPVALIAAALAAAKKIFDGLKEAIMSTTFAMNALNTVGQVTKQMFYDIAVNGKLSIDSMIKAAEAADLMNKKRVRDIHQLIEFAALEREIAIVESDAADKTKTHAERAASLNIAVAKQNELSDKKIEDAKEDLRITRELIVLRPRDEKLREQEARNIKTLIDLDKERFEQNKRNVGKITGFAQEEIDAHNKMIEAWHKEIEEQNKAFEEAQERLNKAIDDDFKRWSDYWDKRDKEEADAIDRAQKRFNDYWDYKDKLEEERRKADIQAGFEYQKLKAGYDLDALNTILDAEYGAMLTSTDYERMTANQKLLIDEQYTKAKGELSLARIEQTEKEKSMVANAFGVMSDVIGKETLVGKSLAIAQATINTWVAASQALRDPTLPSVIMKIAAMVSIIGTGLMTVANIVKVKVPGGGGGGGGVSTSMPTSITSSLSAQRIFSSGVAPSYLTQPQLSQTQLNATTPGMVLTANDIADAVSKLPAPIVTVEDINVKAESKKKVEVRANI